LLITIIIVRNIKTRYRTVEEFNLNYTAVQNSENVLNIYGKLKQDGNIKVCELVCYIHTYVALKAVYKRYEEWKLTEMFIRLFIQFN
jgi:hypothetical protein